MASLENIQIKAISPNKEERLESLRLMRETSPDLNDNPQTWGCLHRLTQDTDNTVRLNATDVLMIFFSFPDYKKMAWEDLHMLLQDKNDSIREQAVHTLDQVFSKVPDAHQAWKDLHDLAQDPNDHIRIDAAIFLGRNFSIIPDIFQAQEDLCLLTEDIHYYVRYWAGNALSNAFPYVPDKDKAWDSLYKLTQQVVSEEDDYFYISHAYHWLGKVCIFKATEAQNEHDMRAEVKRAIEFFNTSSQLSYVSPARFCLPFYRSFDAIIFKNEEDSLAEVQNNIQTAKSEVHYSKYNELLIKTVEKLSLARRSLQIKRQ